MKNTKTKFLNFQNSKIRVLKKTIQKLVIKSNKYSFFYNLNKSIYSFALKRTVHSFQKLPFIVSIYIRRSMLTKKIEPGSSDIDLSIIFEDLPLEKEVIFMKQFLKKYTQLKKLFPFLGEVVILSKSELKLWLKHGGSHAYEAVNTWKLLFGKSMLPKKIKNDLKNEFSRAITWYLHYLLNYYLTMDLNKNYLRPVYNSYQNITAHLEVCGYKKNKDLILLEEELKLVKKNNYFSKKGELLTKAMLVYLLNGIEETSKEILKLFKKKKQFEQFDLFDENNKKIILSLNALIKKSIFIQRYSKEIFPSSAGCSKYKYRLNIILKENLSNEKLFSLFTEIKLFYQENETLLNSKSMDSFKPIQILKNNAFKFNLIYPHGWPGLELFYLGDKFSSWKPLFDEAGLKADLSFFPAYHRMVLINNYNIFYELFSSSENYINYSKQILKFKKINSFFIKRKKNYYFNNYKLLYGFCRVINSNLK